MRRSLVNFIVDTAIAVAFVTSAISGLIFLLPTDWLVVPGTSSTSALGVEYAAWRTVHDWSAVVMIAGVALHTALHWAWIKAMVRRLARDAGLADRPARRGPTPAGARSGAVRGATGAAAEHGASRAATVARATGPAATRTAVNRRTFVKKAGAVGAAALIGGLVGRSAADAAVTWLDGSGGENRILAASDADEGWSYGDGEANVPNAETPAQSGGGSTQSATTVARVTIDRSRCTDCGRCLSVCPYGVFSSGSSVTVSDPDACRFCRRCTQACPTAAIALNG